MLLRHPVCPALEAQAALRTMVKESEDPDKQLQNDLAKEEDEKRDKKAKAKSARGRGRGRGKGRGRGRGKSSDAKTSEPTPVPEPSEIAPEPSTEPAEAVPEPSTEPAEVVPEPPTAAAPVHGEEKKLDMKPDAGAAELESTNTADGANEHDRDTPACKKKTLGKAIKVAEDAGYVTFIQCQKGKERRCPWRCC